MTDKNVLSDREREILQLVAEGLTNREIAQRLSISHNTVKVHLSNIFEKTGVASRTEATLYAIQHRIVDVPGGEDEPKKPKLSWVWVAVSMLFVLAMISLIGNLISGNNSLNNVPVVDASERWQELEPLPDPYTDMAVVAYSGEIFVIGGRGLDGVSGKGFRYIPESDEWLPISDKPTTGLGRESCSYW